MQKKLYSPFPIIYDNALISRHVDEEILAGSDSNATTGVNKPISVTKKSDVAEKKFTMTVIVIAPFYMTYTSLLQL